MPHCHSHPDTHIAHMPLEVGLLPSGSASVGRISCVLPGLPGSHTSNHSWGPGPSGHQTHHWAFYCWQELRPGVEGVSSIPRVIFLSEIVTFKHTVSIVLFCFLPFKILPSPHGAYICIWCDPERDPSPSGTPSSCRHLVCGPQCTSNTAWHPAQVHGPVSINLKSGSLWKQKDFYNCFGVKWYKAPFIPLSVNIHVFCWYRTVEILMCLIPRVLPQSPLGCYQTFGLCTIVPC